MMYRGYEIKICEAFTGYNYQIDTSNGEIANTGNDNEYGKFDSVKEAEIAAKKAVSEYIASTTTVK